MSKETFEAIKKKLDDAGITYTTEHHEPTRTSEDAARIRGTELGTGAKALVMRGKKSGSDFLFILPADLRLDTKKIRDLIGERVSFCPEVESITSCKPGSVPPFGSVLGIKIYCDKRLSKNKGINFNAGLLTDSINMSYQDYIRIENPEIVDIAE